MITAPATLLATLLIGFTLGLRHALDTDHMVAVSTLVARERSIWKSTKIGAVWGLGHTATLLVMGVLIIVLGLKIPESLVPYLEVAVAAMLIFLGARTFWQLMRGQGHFCTHNHGETHVHTHFHQFGAHECADEPNVIKRDGAHRQSFLVGMVHGLSGSAELMLLVLATIRQPVWALTYIAMFGMGMMVAMFLITTAFALALDFTSRSKVASWKQIDLGLRALTGAASCGFGAYLLWGIAGLAA